MIRREMKNKKEREREAIWLHKFFDLRSQNRVREREREKERKRKENRVFDGYTVLVRTLYFGFFIYL